jgi:hypothetical protein
MGSVYFGVPTQLAEFMQKEFKLSVFVETGTYLAATATWASSIFEEVFTIELSPFMHENAIKKYGSISNIKFLHGESKTVLKDILNEKSSPMLFWLDAHWSGGNTAGENIQCPLLEELKIILDSNSNHFILIDDARLILASPPASLRKLYDLPSFGDVIQVLDSLGPRYSIVWRDVLLSVPLGVKEQIYRFMEDQGDLVFYDAKDDFSSNGIGLILKSWQNALRGLFYIPGALYRSIRARIG